MNRNQQRRWGNSTRLLAGAAPSSSCRPLTGGGQAGVQWGGGSRGDTRTASDLVDWVLYVSPLILELAKMLLEIAIIHQWHR